MVLPASTEGENIQFHIIIPTPSLERAEVLDLLTSHQPFVMESGEGVCCRAHQVASSEKEGGMRGGLGEENQWTGGERLENLLRE